MLRRRNHILLQQQQQQHRPKLLVRQFFQGYDFQKIKSSIISSSSSSSCVNFEFQPKFSAALVNNNNNDSSSSKPSLNITLSSSTPNECEHELLHQISTSSSRTWWNGSSKMISSNSQSKSENSSTTSWNAYIGTASDFKTKSEIFDHDQELVKSTSSSTGMYYSCRSQLPSDVTILSSAKNWLAKSLKNGSGAVFQRVESQKAEALVSKQQVSKIASLSADSSPNPTSPLTSPLATTTGQMGNYSMKESEMTARSLSASFMFENKTKKDAENMFGEEMELAERSPIFALNSEMNQWCVVGDTASFPLNVRRLLLNFFTSYCMKELGAVPIAAECICDISKQKSVLIMGPQQSGKTSLAKHVVARNPEKFQHVGSGIVMIAPCSFEYQQKQQQQESANTMMTIPLRIIPLPLAPTFSDAGVLWSALIHRSNKDEIDDEKEKEEAKAKNYLKKWAQDELRNLPPEWSRKLELALEPQNGVGAVPKNSFFSSSSSSSSSSSLASSFADFELNGIVSLNWDIDSLGEFEEKNLLLNNNSTSIHGEFSKEQKATILKKIKDSYPCYVREMDQEDVAKCFSHSSCPPFLPRGIYFHEPQRLSNQLFEWGMLMKEEEGNNNFISTEVNGSVRFDLVSKHVAQVLESF